jgi:hypothetical protein
MDALARDVADLQAALGRSIDGVVGRMLHALGTSGGCCGPSARSGHRRLPDASARGEAAAEAEIAEETSFTASERRILSEIEDTLQRGRELKRWWDRVHPADSFAERFELGRTFNEPDVSFGFFDSIEIGGASMSIMGNFQEMFYDRPKTPVGIHAVDAAAWMRDQMREFVLRYFMRISDFRDPEGFAETWRPPSSGLFEPLSWCPRSGSTERGFGFQQLLYKRRDSGEIGRFSEAEESRIIDLRELGSTYEWIVVKVRIFDFQFDLAPFGPGLPKLVVPLEEDSYLVVSRDLVTIEEEPEPGVLGRYGIGYSFLRNPEPGLVQYGPGEFDAAIEQITFEVREDGVVRVPMVFVANRPRQILRVDLDPLRWGAAVGDLATFGLLGRLLGVPASRLLAAPPDRPGFDPVYAYVDFARFVSGGLSEEVLCITREQLDKEFLVKHFEQHYQTIAGSLATWRTIPDWSDEIGLPRWVVAGDSG